MTTKPFDFWQDHSRQFLEMALGQERRERVVRPDGYGKRTGDCGDTVEFFIDMEKDRIRSVCYLTDGCLNTNACANTVAHLIEGRSIEAAWEVTPEVVSPISRPCRRRAVIARNWPSAPSIKPWPI